MPILFCVISSDGVRIFRNLWAIVTHCPGRSRDHFCPSSSVFWPKCVPCGHRWGADSLGRLYSLACLGKHFFRQRERESVIAYLIRILSISASHAAPPHATIGPHPLHDCGSVSGAGGDQCDARRFAGRPLLSAPFYRLPIGLAHILAYRDAGVFACANTDSTDSRWRG